MLAASVNDKGVAGAAALRPTRAVTGRIMPARFPHAGAGASGPDHESDAPSSIQAAAHVAQAALERQRVKTRSGAAPEAVQPRAADLGPARVLGADSVPVRSSPTAPVAPLVSATGGAFGLGLAHRIPGQPRAAVEPPGAESQPVAQTVPAPLLLPLVLGSQQKAKLG